MIYILFSVYSIFIYIMEDINIYTNTQFKNVVDNIMFNKIASCSIGKYYIITFDKLNQSQYLSNRRIYK